MLHRGIPFCKKEFYSPSFAGEQTNYLDLRVLSAHLQGFISDCIDIDRVHKESYSECETLREAKRY